MWETRKRRPCREVTSNEIVKMRNTKEANYIIYATVIFWRDSRVRGVDVLP